MFRSSHCRIAIFSVSAENSNPEGMRDITTMELVQEMGIGINLGNTLESCGDWIAHGVMARLLLMKLLGAVRL